MSIDKHKCDVLGLEVKKIMHNARHKEVIKYREMIDTRMQNESKDKQIVLEKLHTEPYTMEVATQIIKLKNEIQELGKYYACGQFYKRYGEHAEILKEYDTAMDKLRDKETYLVYDIFDVLQYDEFDTGMIYNMLVKFYNQDTLDYEIIKN